MIKATLQTVAGALLVVLALAVVDRVIDARKLAKLPEGWQIISPPVDTGAILISAGKVWTGGRDGIVLLDETTRQVLPLAAQLQALRMVRAIEQDTAGAIWIAHDRGVTREGPEGWQSLSSEALLLSGPAMSLLAEPGGVMVIGGMGGAVRWFAGQVTPLPLPPGRLELVSTLFRDHDGGLWLGSDTPHRGGLSVWTPDGQWQSYKAGRDLVHGSINDILQQPDGTLWVATGFAGRGGVSLFDGTTWRGLPDGNALAGRKVRSLFRDQNGLIWLGFEYDGASVLVDGVWQHLTADDGLAGKEVKVIRQGTTGTYWIATTSGLSVIEPRAWQSVAHPSDEETP